MLKLFTFTKQKKKKTYKHQKFKFDLLVRLDMKEIVTDDTLSYPNTQLCKVKWILGIRKRWLVIKVEIQVKSLVIGRLQS